MDGRRWDWQKCKKDHGKLWRPGSCGRFDITDGHIYWPGFLISWVVGKVCFVRCANNRDNSCALGQLFLLNHRLVLASTRCARNRLGLPASATTSLLYISQSMSARYCNRTPCKKRKPDLGHTPSVVLTIWQCLLDFCSSIVLLLIQNLHCFQSNCYLLAHCPFAPVASRVSMPMRKKFSGMRKGHS